MVAVLPCLPVKLQQPFWTLKQSLFLASFNFRIYNNKSPNTFFQANVPVEVDINALLSKCFIVSIQKGTLKNGKETLLLAGS